MLDGIPASLLSGLILGLSAGLSPGPLTALVLRESLSRSAAAGVRVACAPLLTDIPIVAIAILVVGKLSELDGALCVIAGTGAVFLFYLGWETLGSRSPIGGEAAAGGSLLRGVLVNFLSPNPYLFWITVGAPTVVQAAASSLPAAAAFIGGFYVFLVGSKIAVALACGRFGHRIEGTTYIWIMRLLGVALWFLGLAFLYQAIQYLIGA